MRHTARIIEDIKVDVSRKNVFEAIVAKQNDVSSRFLRVTLSNLSDKMRINAKDSRAIVNFCRADGQSKSFPAEINPDGTVTAPLTIWALEAEGMVRCSISILGADGTKLTSTTFWIDVEKSEISSDDITNDDTYDVLLKLLSDCDEAKRTCEESAKAANKAAALANEARIASNAATEKANTAYGLANSAAQSANTATSAATAAAEAANQAAEAAQEVIEQADFVFFINENGGLSVKILKEDYQNADII